MNPQAMSKSCAATGPRKRWSMERVIAQREYSARGRASESISDKGGLRGNGAAWRHSMHGKEGESRVVRKGWTATVPRGRVPEGEERAAQ